MSNRKKLYVGTVNGENSLTNKSAKTFAHAFTVEQAVNLLKVRYMKKFGKAEITELFMYVDGKPKRVL